MSRYSEATDEYREGVKARTREKRIADPHLYLYMKALRRARRDGIRFKIKPSDLIIPMRCPVLGIPIQVLSDTRHNSATVDRIIPRRGYTPGNVRVISHRANLLKNNANFDELVKLALYVGRETERLAPNEIDKIAKICGVK